MQNISILRVSALFILSLAIALGCALEEDEVEAPPDPRTFDTEFWTSTLPTVAHNLETAVPRLDEPYEADESARQDFVALFREHADYFQDWDTSGWELLVDGDEGTWQYESSTPVKRRWTFEGHADVAFFNLEIDYNGDGSLDADDYEAGSTAAILAFVVHPSQTNRLESSGLYFLYFRARQRQVGAQQSVTEDGEVLWSFSFSSDNNVSYRGARDGSSGYLRGRTADTEPLFEYRW